MLNQFKMKLCYATIPMILGAYSQPMYATETMTLPSQTEEIKLLFSALPPPAFSPMSDLKDNEALLKWANSFNPSRGDSSPLPQADEATHRKWLEDLTASIDARSKELEDLSVEIERLSKEIKSQEKKKASLYAQEGGPKVSNSKKKKRAPLAREISNLQTQLQKEQIKLTQLNSQQEFEIRLRHKIGEYRVYARVSDYFGDSTLGKVLKVPALFGVSMFGPMLNDMPSLEQMREVKIKASGSLSSEDSDTLSTSKESMETIINAILIGGSIALNHGITANPYLYASVLFSSLYKESSMVKQYADQVVRAYLGSEISPKAAERLAWAVAIGYAIYYLPGAAAFPYAAPGTEVNLDTTGATNFQMTGSGNTLFITKTNTTNVVGKYYNSTLVATSPELSISESALPASSSATDSIILSDGVTTVAGYQIAANSGDIVLRAGNSTNGFVGPEVTLTPTVGAQNGLSLVPLLNNQLAALVQTNPTGSNYDIIGYTYGYNTTNGLTLLQGPYPGNTVTTADQGSQSAALYGDGNIGCSYLGTQSGSNKQYHFVVNPKTGANVVPDYALDPTGGSQGNGVSMALQNGNIVNGFTDGTTLKSVITTSSGGSGAVTQFNNASLTSLSQNPVYGTTTVDGNFAYQYSAFPVPIANQQVYYAVGSSTGVVLSSDTQIPTSSNGGVGVGIQALPGGNLAALFDGPDLIGTVIQNQESTTPPTSSPTGVPTTTSPSGGSTTSSPSGGSTTTSPSGGSTTTGPTGGSTSGPTTTSPSGGSTTSGPTGIPTTTPTSAGNSLTPPFPWFFKGVSSVVSGSIGLVRRAIGK